jgi:hypothetical protein
MISRQEVRIKVTPIPKTLDQITAEIIKHIPKQFGDDTFKINVLQYLQELITTRQIKEYTSKNSVQHLYYRENRTRPKNRKMSRIYY